MSNVLNLNLTHTALWYAMSLARTLKLPSVVNDSWVSDAPVLEPVIKRFTEGQGEIVFEDSRPGSGYHEAVIQCGQTVVRLSKERRDFNCSIFAENRASAQQTFEAMRELLPSAERKEKLLDVTFWYSTAHGPRRYDRQLQAPAWADIEGNYPRLTREKIDSLRTVELTEGAGKLILWQGEPGTGKTFALRALGEEWASWCRVHYVLDPERFFTEGEYLLNVILEDGGSVAYIGSDQPAQPRPSWRLIVLEDAGEMLAKDAKEKVGQGLARLLNLCDGLLGQGLRVLVLITTNEQVGSLHEAVSRPGRCLSHIIFDKFDVNGASNWLKDHGSTASVIGSASLADLYALAHGKQLTERKVAGFK